MADDPVNEIAQALAAQLGAVKGVAKALPFEPLQAPAMPLVTTMFRGFTRRGLETPQLQSAPIRDPLGGRRWVWRYWVRLWIQLTDAEASQNELNALVPQLVKALEADRTLGTVAVDAALSSGDAAVIRPKGGNPYLMLTCDCAVETEEAI